MDFILRYRGPLHSNGNTIEKHNIRSVFNKQIAELCTQEPLFKDAKKDDLPEGVLKSREVEVPRPLKNMFFYVNLKNFNFIPIISRPHQLACSIDILMLRREKPGAIVTHGGDLDNRLKTLFDALRMPHTESELSNIEAPTEAEKFYCLLEDDSLINKVSVSTQQLLEPLEPGENPATVEMLLHVFVQSTYPMWGNVGF